MTYAPIPNSIPARALAFLQDQAQAGRFWVPAVEIEDHLDQCPIGPYLERAVNHGLLRKEHMATDRRRSQYALGDGKALPLPRDVDGDEDAPAEKVAPTIPPPAAWPPTTKATPMKKKMTKPAVFADIEALKITDDPVPQRALKSGDKYGEIFGQMKPGQALVCKPEDGPKIANAMRKWIKVRRPGMVVRTVRYYPKDNQGRVWMLDGKGAKA